MNRAPSAMPARFSCLLALALLVGCAAPGDPTPRLPVVPAAIKDLEARQSGPAVELSFTLPRESIDRKPLAEPPAIEIYRAPLASTSGLDRNPRWRLVYRIPPERIDAYAKGDRIEFLDPLTPGDLEQAAGTALTYMVRTEVSRQRSSGDSNAFALRVYPPPEAPSGVHPTVTETAITISWTEVPSPGGSRPDGYRVYRAEVEPQKETPPPAQPNVTLKSPLGLLGTVSSTEYRDTQFGFGRTYLYTVRSLATYGQDLVESADGAPAMVTPIDTFPPAAPTGFVAALVPATPEAPPYVELSWAISPEADLAGYRIYRSEQESTQGEQMNAILLPSPAFRDISVVAGRGYFYRVTAVDRAGNESNPSAAVRVEVPQGSQ